MNPIAEQNQTVEPKRSVFHMVHGFHKVTAAALFATVLLASVAAHAAFGGGGGGVSLTCLPATTTFTTAKFVCTTNVATTLSIGTGTTKVVGDLVTTTDSSRTHHNVTVRGLSPNMQYYALVTATTKHGASAKNWYGPHTAAPGSAPATVTSSGNKLLLNGQPWFARFADVAGCPDQTVIDSDSGVGLSLLVGTSCVGNGNSTTVQDFANLLGSKAWWMELQPSNIPHLSGLPQIFGWSGSSKDASLAGVFPVPDVCQGKTPIDSWINKQLQAISTKAAHHPAITSLWVAQKLEDSLTNCLTVNQLATYSWSAIVEGAEGLDYQTYQPIHTAQVPSFNVSPSIQNQIKNQGNQIGTLATVLLLGKKIYPVTNASSVIKFAVWQYGGLYYALAVNPSSTTATTSFTLNALSKGGTAHIMFQGKSLKLKPGAVPVTLKPFASNWYKITPTK